eukprot:364425-Chlamydomonas_euryale.AAC.7
MSAAGRADGLRGSLVCFGGARLIVMAGAASRSAPLASSPPMRTSFTVTSCGAAGIASSGKSSAPAASPFLAAMGTSVVGMPRSEATASLRPAALMLLAVAGARGEAGGVKKSSPAGAGSGSGASSDGTSPHSSVPLQRRRASVLHLFGVVPALCTHAVANGFKGEQGCGR